MKKTRLYGMAVFLSVFVAFVLPAAAQQDYASQIKISKQTIEKKATSINISMDIDVSELHINTQHLVLVTPVIIANDGSHSRRLQPVALSGNTRDKVLKRNSEKRKQNLFENNPPAEIVRRRNATPQTIPYTVSIPMENWLKNARLTLDISVTGCTDCDIQQGEMLLAERIFKEPFVPVYKLTYITPEVEPVKNRCDNCVAYLQYKVARAEILPMFGNNAQELEMIRKTITDVKRDKNITVTSLTVTGYASPEGSFNSNLNLSERRAKALANHIADNYGMPVKDVKWYGEDWNGLQKAVTESELPDKDKEEVLNIIRAEPSPDARDAKLKKLAGGATYRILLTVFYPPLRRNEYAISYVARGFNVEEARKIIKTNPRLLSLNEMYMVATSYPPASKEWNEAFGIAAQYYPDSEIAILNLAAADIENGNMRQAIDRLFKIKDNHRVWNNLGVAYARAGDTEKAGEYFDKAAHNGDADAAHNKEQLAKSLDAE